MDDRLALPQPDPAVLRKAQKGDREAFTLIVRAYETPIHNYILRLTGDRTLAEDLTFDEEGHGVHDQDAQKAQWRIETEFLARHLQAAAPLPR